MIDITVPGILAGGFGQSQQQLGSDVRAAATQVGGLANRIAQQADYVKATRAETDMLAEKQKNVDDFIRTSDGTDMDAYKKFIKLDEEIGQKYVRDEGGYGLGPAGRRFIELKHVESQQRHGVQVQKKLDELLFNASQATTTARVDNEIRAAVSTGEFQLGLQKVGELIDSQRGYFGNLNTDALKKAEMARYTETWMKTSLADPNTSKMMVKRLDDPVQKKQFYAYINAAKIDEMEKLIETTRMHNYARDKEEKEARYEDTLADIMQGIVTAQEYKDPESGKSDPQLRELAYQNGVRLINEGLASRLFRGSDVGKLYKTLQDFREGKLQSTDSYYMSAIWADIGDGRKNIREVLTDDRIAPMDKISMYKFIVSERNQDRRAAMTAGAMARAVSRQNFGDMVKFAHPTGPTATMQMGNYQAFSRDAAQAVSKGSDPWTFYYENYTKYFPSTMPTISVPGMGVVTPRDWTDINKVTKWLPSIKDTKKANAVADQLEQARRLMKVRDYNATQKGAQGERKTKP